MKDLSFYLKYLWTQFWYTLLYQDRRIILVSFKNCMFKAKMGDSSPETYINLNKIFLKALKENSVECVVNGEPAKVTYTFCGTLKVFSNMEVDKDHPYFNLDVKA